MRHPSVGPRIIRTAPNGDVFVADVGNNAIKEIVGPIDRIFANGFE